MIGKGSFSRRQFVRLAGGFSVAGIGGLALRSGAGAGFATPAAGTPAAGTPVAEDPARQLLLRVSLAGGFVPAIVNVARLPLASVYADGSVVTEGPMIEIYPQPILPNLRRTVLTPEGLAAVLDTAETAIAPLDGQVLEGAPVTDMPDTVFTLLGSDRTLTASAYALGFDEATVPVAARAGRAALVALRDLLFDLPGKLEAGQVASADEAFPIDRLRVYALPIDPANPPGDPDLPQEPIAWPLATDLADFGASAEPPLDAEGFRCDAIAGEDAATLVRALATANQLTPWESGGARYVLWIRPLLPDEPTGCAAG